MPGDLSRLEAPARATGCRRSRGRRGESRCPSGDSQPPSPRSSSRDRRRSPQLPSPPYKCVWSLESGFQWPLFLPQTRQRPYQTWPSAMRSHLWPIGHRTKQRQRGGLTPQGYAHRWAFQARVISKVRRERQASHCRRSSRAPRSAGVVGPRRDEGRSAAASDPRPHRRYDTQAVLAWLEGQRVGSGGRGGRGTHLDGGTPAVVLL